MATYHRIPAVKSYFLFMAPVIAIAAVAPFVLCFQFPTGDNVVPTCILTWQQRTTQSGLLLTYTSAVLGVLSLYWQSRVDANRLLAESQIASKSRWLAELERTQERAGSQTQNIAECRNEIRIARSELDKAGLFPELLRRAAWVALLLIATGTVMQVIGSGQVTANNSSKPTPLRGAA